MQYIPSLNNILFPRWNSTFDMLGSFVRTEEPLILTLRETDQTPFSDSEWNLMRKVITVLQPFKEATLDLSKRDASISMCIPTVTTIMNGLEEHHDDFGVRTMKRSMWNNMGERFSNMEFNRHYTIATLLDSKYKGCFYRYPMTLINAKEYLIDEVAQLLREENEVIQ